MTTPPVAYSYIRFSTPEQRKGDSLRRQTEGATAWSAKNAVPLDTSLTLHDKGCSAYKGLHRENPDKHALALFLKLVEKGRVRSGDYLLIENLDRLSREEEVPACHLLTGILMAGVRVVQLSPYEMLLTEKSNGWELMRAVMELSRGHNESKIKSERVDKAWQERLAKTRKGELILTHVLPAWVEERGGKLHLLPAREAAVRRIYQLAAAGYGHVRIVKALRKEKIAPFGGRESYIDEEGKQRWRAVAGDCYGSGQWTKAYVHKLLNDERVLGVFQPLRADGSLDGPPLPNYFPAVITQEEWNEARAGAVRRGIKNGKKCNNSTKHIDVFAGLVHDARDGGAMFTTTRTAYGRHTRMLVSAHAREGRLPAVTFPYHLFEQMILDLLHEIPASEVTGEDDAPNEVMVLSGELERIEAELNEATAFLGRKGFSVAIGEHITDLEARYTEAADKLVEANQRAAHPLAESWGEFVSLWDALKKSPDPDDTRLRIRTALRRTVETIMLLIVPRRKQRLAAVQIWFRGGSHRDYLLTYRKATGGAAGNRPAQGEAISLAKVADVKKLDLRRRDDALALAEEIAETDLSWLTTDEYRLDLQTAPAER